MRGQTDGSSRLVPNLQTEPPGRRPPVSSYTEYGTIGLIIRRHGLVGELREAIWLFPHIQTLRGELKRTEVRFGVRYHLTTREFILQRSSRTYRIALENILGLLEVTDKEFALSGFRGQGHETSGTPYKIVATVVHMISPRGVVEQQQVSFYTRLSHPFAAQMEALLSKSG